MNGLISNFDICSFQSKIHQFITSDKGIIQFLKQMDNSKVKNSYAQNRKSHRGFDGQHHFFFEEDGCGENEDVVCLFQRSFRGVLTIGDIQRAILNNVALTEPIHKILDSCKVYASPSESRIVSRSKCTNFVRNVCLLWVKTVNSLRCISGMIFQE